MIDAQLVADYMRMIEEDGKTALQVAMVKWPPPGEPVFYWRTFRKWARPPSPERLMAAQAKALSSKRFFRRCTICGEICQAGYMFNAEVCYSCVEEKLGLIF